jgi:hypothetical protein
MIKPIHSIYNKYNWASNLDIANKFLSDLKKNYKYGEFIEGFILRPEDLMKYKVGTCHDYTLLEYTYLKKNYEKVSAFYFDSKLGSRTHSSVIIELKNKFYNFEFAWFDYNSKIWEFNSLDDLFREIKHRDKLSGSEVTYLNKNINVDKILKINSKYIDKFDYLEIVGSKYVNTN